jgi:tRNA(fMet)-specific endonuclease VapC
MSGNPYLLDTSVILNLVRDNELGKYIMARFGLEDMVHRPLICVVTVGEIWALADRRRWEPRKREFVKKVLETMVVLDLNHEAILNGYVEMDRASHAAPQGARNLSDNDLWIAATARATGAVLLTSDKDFLHFHPDHCFVQYIDPAAGRGGIPKEGRAQ